MKSESKLLNDKKNRIIAIILSAKERDCDDYLPEEISQKLRKIILDQINAFHELAAGMLEDAVISNDIYLERRDIVG